MYNKYVPTAVTVTLAAARLPRKHDGYNMYASTELLLLLLLLYASFSDDDDDDDDICVPYCVLLTIPWISKCATL